MVVMGVFVVVIVVAVVVVMVMMVMAMNSSVSVCVLMCVLENVSVGLVMSVYMLVGVALLPCSTEKTAHFVWRQIRYDRGSLLKIEGNIFYMMCFEHAHHHLLVHCQRNVHRRTLDNCRPMLVPYGMAKLHGYADYILGCLRRELAHIDYQHGAQCQTQYYGLFFIRIEIDYIAVGYLGMSCQCHGIIYAVVAFAEETTFLGCPLVEENGDNFHSIELMFPFRLMGITQNFSEYLHMNDRVKFSRARTAVGRPRPL